MNECTACGEHVSAFLYERNDGLCKACASAELGTEEVTPMGKIGETTGKCKVCGVEFKYIKVTAKRTTCDEHRTAWKAKHRVAAKAKAERKPKSSRLPPPAAHPAPNGALPSLAELRAAIAVVQRFADGLGRMLSP